jgi:hypothetical protein
MERIVTFGVHHCVPSSSNIKNTSNTIIIEKGQQTNSMIHGYDKVTLVAMLVLMSASHFVNALPNQKNAPIMAIVVEPFAWSPPECVSVWGRASFSTAKRPPRTHGVGNSTPPPVQAGCVWSIYVDWLEASGIRVIPLPWNAPTSRMDYLLDRVNGVLFPGGIIQGDAPVTDAYFATVQYIFNRAVSKYFMEDHDGFVVWGTCQGFELLNAAAAGTMDVVESGFVGTDPSMLPVTFLPDAATSGSDRLYRGLVAPLREALTTENVTLNWHSKGVPPTAYNSTKYHKTLGALLQPLTVSFDATGRSFVSSMQGINDTIRVFATQFHPERPPYEFDNDVISHDASTIGISQFLSLQLRKWLSESSHAFENATEANELMIETFPRVNQGWGVQVYFI